MKTAFVLALLLISALAAKKGDNFVQLAAEAEAAGDDDGDAGSSACQVLLVKNLRKFEVIHQLDGAQEKDVQYIAFKVEIKEKNMQGCVGAYTTDLLLTQKDGSRKTVTSIPQYSVTKESVTEKAYKVKVSDVEGVRSDFKEFTIKGKKTPLSILAYTLQYIANRANGTKELLAEYTFKHYVNIDDAVGAYVDTEARADANITKTHIVWSAEDCADDGDLAGCVAKINLNTTLSCFKDVGLAQKLGKNSSILVGDYIYCELKYIDETIQRYLHLTQVRVKTEDETKDILPTGYYTFIERTRHHVVFRILVYWPRTFSSIIANAKVSGDSECHADDDCISCNEHRCLECAHGYVQGKECVESCNKGHFLQGAECLECEENCAKCTDEKTCTLCSGAFVLQNGDCLPECKEGYVNKNGICVEKPKVTVGAHRNLDFSDLVDSGCVVKYHEVYSHHTTNAILTNIRNGCKPNTLVLQGATLLSNEDDIDTAAVDNCKFALFEEPKVPNSWGTLRSQHPGLYWGRRTGLCWAASKHARFNWNQCHAINKGNYPEVQFHLLGYVGGYACRQFTGNNGNKFKKLIMTCD